MKKIDDYLEFLLQEKGTEIQYKGQLKKVLIMDARDKINFYNDKFVRTDFEIRTGEAIEYQGSKWIVISEIDKSRLSYRARMRKSNYKIKMIIDEVLCELDTIIEGISFGIEAGKYMDFEDGKIEVTIPADDVSNKIDVDTRFIKMDNVWKIVGVDKSRLGLITLYCKKDIFNVNDDKKNELADTNKLINYTVVIHEQVSEIIQGQTYQYTATIYKNGIENQDKSINWSASNSNASITSDGLVKGVSLGTTTIKAYISDKPEIFETIEIKIVEDTVNENVTYKMWISDIDGSNKNYTYYSIPFGTKKWFGVDKFVNGKVATVNDKYVYSLDLNGLATSSVDFNVLDDYKVEIKNNGSAGRITLSGISNKTGEIITESIKIESLF